MREELALRAWHAKDPVDAHELKRNAAIQAEQQKRNSLVDCPLHARARPELSESQAAGRESGVHDSCWHSTVSGGAPRRVLSLFAVSAFLRNAPG